MQSQQKRKIEYSKVGWNEDVCEKTAICTYSYRIFKSIDFLENEFRVNSFVLINKIHAELTTL
jgi:hypothetical protein